MGIMAGPDLQAFLHTTTSVKSFFHAAWRVAFHVLDLITYRRGMQLVNGPALIARLVKSADALGVTHVGRFPGDRPDHRRRTARSPARCCTGPTARSPSPRPEGVLLAAGGFPNDVDAASRTLPENPDRQGALDPGAARDHRRRRQSRRVRRRTARQDAGLARGVVPGVAGALPERPGRDLPAHRRPRQAGADRRRRQRQAVRQRGRRLLPVHHRDDQRHPRGRTGAGLADLRPEVPASLPVRHVQAVPGPDLAVPAVRVPEAGKDAGRIGARSAASTRRAWSRRSPSSTGTPGWARTRSSTAAARPSTGRRATKSTSPTRRWPRWRRVRSTRSRCCPAVSAPSSGCEPTPMPGCWTPPASPIAGLYVAGSDQANVMGGHYPSGGINIGPAMTFGYIAGRHDRRRHGLRERRAAICRTTACERPGRTAGITATRSSVAAVASRPTAPSTPMPAPRPIAARAARSRVRSDLRRSAVARDSWRSSARSAPMRSSASLHDWRIVVHHGQLLAARLTVRAEPALRRPRFVEELFEFRPPTRLRRTGSRSRSLAAMRGHPHRRIQLPVAGVPADPLHDLEEDPTAEHLGVEVQELARRRSGRAARSAPAVAVSCADGGASRASRSS